MLPSYYLLWHADVVVTAAAYLRALVAIGLHPAHCGARVYTLPHLEKPAHH